MRQMANIGIAIIFLMLAPVLLFAGEDLYFSPVNVDFYGYIEGAVAGDQVCVYDAEGVLCGIFKVEKPGMYGLLHVYGDDPSTSVDEGALPGDTLRFEMNGMPLMSSAKGPITWTRDGERIKLDFEQY